MELATIDGLPAIEFIEATDDVHHKRYAIQFKDGRRIEFAISHADMIEYSRSYPGTNAARSLITKRAKQAYEAS